MDMIPKADHEAAVSKAVAAAITGERNRIASIVNCEAAKERPAAALKLALTPGANVEMASAMLGTIAAEKSAAPTPQFTGQRSKDAPGGLVVDAVSHADGPREPQTDFERGRALAKACGGKLATPVVDNGRI